MLFLLLTLVLGVDAPPDRCSVRALRSNPEGYFWSLDRIRSFVDSADVIVRARADYVIETPAGQSAANPRSDVQFVVLEVLRGRPPVELRVGGYFVDHDDFNRGDVPYRIVRPSGQRGSCFTQEYRRGAEYLLLLRDAPHVLPIIAEGNEPRLTPYWAALAPLNEQVRGPDDPWVVWVRSAVR